MRDRTGRGTRGKYISQQCAWWVLLNFSSVCTGRKVEKMMVTVSLLTVNIERGAFLSPLLLAANFHKFFPVRLN